MKKLKKLSVIIIVAFIIFTSLYLYKLINKPYIILKQVSNSYIYQIEIKDNDKLVTKDFSIDMADNKQSESIIEIIYDNLFKKVIFINEKKVETNNIRIKVADIPLSSSEKIHSSFVITIYENGYVYIESSDDVGLETGYYKIFKNNYNKIYEKLKETCYN
ncbi:hypothetical protein JYG23_12210 [Sedimentibacter sp. zth1]|uniref:hypothetical protein n=1 Tax=Sedimentibacter sp. zth1 TaxID=2816908 RepID=UPI001A926385|nr:hypothetical protein [Sedimentibacter sp. zth1]QSX05432.1 hypothetical protein JYG23_12210 [Sedimentibacter sp. zth1]